MQLYTGSIVVGQLASQIVQKTKVDYGSKECRASAAYYMKSPAKATNGGKDKHAK